MEKLSIEHENQEMLGRGLEMKGYRNSSSFRSLEIEEPYNDGYQNHSGGY
jgi:hypothetical protein